MYVSGCVGVGGCGCGCEGVCVGVYVVLECHYSLFPLENVFLTLS